jgi:hypothetical protein
MFGRNLWALLCLELWQETFHECQADWQALEREAEAHQPIVPDQARVEGNLPIPVPET